MSTLTLELPAERVLIVDPAAAEPAPASWLLAAVTALHAFRERP